MTTRLRLPYPRLLTLDAFGTIYTPNPSVAEQYARIHARYFPPVPASSIASAFRVAFKDRVKTHANYLGGEREWWHAVIRSTFALAGSEVTGEEGDKFVEALFEWFNGGRAYKFCPDIIPFLDTVQTRVGVLSNSDARCRSVLTALGVLSGNGSGDQDGVVGHGWVHDDDVVLSCDVGVEKPDPRMFLAAQALVGDEVVEDQGGDEIQVAMSRLYWHVGDEERKDVAGIVDNAKLLPHWGAIYVNREGDGTAKLRHGGRVIEVRDLRDLLGLWSTGVDVLVCH